ncbi:gliding motility-associated C-terminal domain-containing protein, partial [Myroides odoratimimus]|uniref:T9SS type B sorting domain-containing protein n=1 Tax=Myroides odoratimimus TaxID=76832 RepID=UPI002576FB59
WFTLLIWLLYYTSIKLSFSYSTNLKVNRWGSKVYDTTKYDPTGDGNVNVFRGKAEGKGVLLSGNLPSGTYYYIVKYEVRTAKGSEWITKTGYLHLENN